MKLILVATATSFSLLASSAFGFERGTLSLVSSEVNLTKAGPVLSAFGEIYNAKILQTRENVATVARLIKAAYGVESDSELFAKILAQRDAVLMAPQSSFLENLVKATKGKVKLGVAGFSFSNEGTLVEVSFQPMDCAPGRISVYKTQLLIRKDDLTVWPYAQDKVTAQVAGCETKFQSEIGNIRFAEPESGEVMQKFVAIMNLLVRQSKVRYERLDSLIRSFYISRPDDYIAKSGDADLFARILGDRDHFLRIPRPLELNKMVTDRADSQVRFGIGDFSVTDEGLVIEASFAANECVIGYLPIYNFGLVIKNDKLQFSSSVKERMERRRMFCAG